MNWVFRPPSPRVRPKDRFQCHMSRDFTRLTSPDALRASFIIDQVKQEGKYGLIPLIYMSAAVAEVDQCQLHNKNGSYSQILTRVLCMRTCHKYCWRMLQSIVFYVSPASREIFVLSAIHIKPQKKNQQLMRGVTILNSTSQVRVVGAVKLPPVLSAGRHPWASVRSREGYGERRFTFKWVKTLMGWIAFHWPTKLFWHPPSHRNSKRVVQAEKKKYNMQEISECVSHWVTDMTLFTAIRSDLLAELVLAPV